MRVISGRLGGRQFDSPKGNRTHPMSDRVRGGLFNSLGDIDALTVLDAYSGSGALAIEAISRGASRATAIDADRNAYDCITHNIRELGLTGKIKVTRALVRAWSTRNQDAHFNLIFADPPYGALDVKTIGYLSRHLISDGILVLSWPGSGKAPEIKDTEKIRSKSYGDAQLVFYRKIS